VAGLGLVIIGFIMEGGSPGMLVAITPAVIVFGGTIGATLTAAPLSVVMNVPKLIMISFRGVAAHGPHLVTRFVELAEKARREGLLALEADANLLENPYMRKGMMLVVDGTDPELVRAIMESEIDAMAERHEAGIQTMEAMGGFAPTMGVLGTVMGLVLVLSNLAEPEELGHKIAVAFIATLYGVGIANLMLLPMAAKLKAISKEEQHERYLIMQGVLSVQAGDNPRIVREKLESFLPPKSRHHDGGEEGGGQTGGGRQARAA
jgi:chemotaxis protein MotA